MNRIRGVITGCLRCPECGNHNGYTDDRLADYAVRIRADFEHIEVECEHCGTAVKQHVEGQINP